MIRKFTLAFVLVLAALIIAPVKAQEGGELKCSVEDTTAVLQTASNLIAEAQGQDVTSQYATIVDLRAALAEIDSACLGLDFEGASNTASDPVFIPAGLYRATLTTDADANMDVDMIILDGACYPAGKNWETTLFDFVGGGSQVMLASEGCTLIWQTEFVHAPYKVSFEKLQ
jgi:hypothetical protein